MITERFSLDERVETQKRSLVNILGVFIVITSTTITIVQVCV